MYIVAIMVTAVVFSVTGLGVLNLATLVNLDTQNAIEKVQSQIEVESLTNVALWRINTGADSLGSFSSGNATSNYDTTTMVLRVEINSEGDTSGFKLSLEEDSHFKRAVGTASSIDYNDGKTVSEEDAHRMRAYMGFLPEVDLDYFVDNAANVSWMDDEHIHDEDVVEGINVFHGNHLDIHNIDVENATLVFTGYDIQLKDDVIIKAPIVGGSPLPALVFLWDGLDTHFDQGWNDEIHIEGAIYSVGHVRLHEGEYSGPVVANTARICRDIDILDDEYSEYYEWNLGFGEYEDYDWPKQIREWENI